MMEIVKDMLTAIMAEGEALDRLVSCSGSTLGFEVNTKTKASSKHLDGVRCYVN